MTRDGVEIVLEANLELPRELEQALAAGAQGLGLVRTEFLYMNRDDLPDEDEQYKAYAGLVRGMDGQAGDHPHPRHRRRQARGAAQRG